MRRSDPLTKRPDVVSRLRAFALILMTVLVAPGVVSGVVGRAQAAESYKLGAMDKLRIKISEWQTATGTFRDWTSVSGEYTLGPSGELSVPFIGEVAAVGKTTAEIATLVSDRLQQKFALLDRPEAAIEIIEFAPVYVTGDVQTPGSHPFVPGLSVIKAISIAGGVRRAVDGNLRIDRDLITAQGEYDVLAKERLRLLAKRARLTAEASDKKTITPPAELNADPQGESLLADETAILDADRRRVGLQLNALSDLKILLENEVKSLQQKQDQQERQLDLSRKDLGKASGLAGQGLVVNQRISQLEQNIADLEGKVLDIDAASLRAKQEISKAAQDAITLENERSSLLALDRQKTDADIEAVQVKMKMQEGLMREALTVAPSATTAQEVPLFKYTILQHGGAEIAAEESSPMQPGDVLKVERLSAVR